MTLYDYFEQQGMNPYHLLEVINDIDGLSQVNKKTKLKLINTNQVEIMLPTSIKKKETCS